VVDAITIHAILNYQQLTQGVEKMQKQIEKKILDFTKLTGLTERITMSHGTLYVTLLQPERCDFFHGIIRTFYKDNINTEGGVNMYAVGDEFAFDFVPADREAPVFTDEEEKGVWSEFAEEEMFDNMDDEDESPAFPSYYEVPADVDTALDLENDAKGGQIT
jgi:hypothetical protein